MTHHIGIYSSNPHNYIVVTHTYYSKYSSEATIQSLYLDKHFHLNSLNGKPLFNFDRILSLELIFKKNIFVRFKFVFIFGQTF